MTVDSSIEIQPPEPLLGSGRRRATASTADTAMIRPVKDASAKAFDRFFYHVKDLSAKVSAFSAAKGPHGPTAIHGFETSVRTMLVEALKSEKLDEVAKQLAEPEGLSVIDHLLDQDITPRRMEICFLPLLELLAALPPTWRQQVHTLRNRVLDNFLWVTIALAASSEDLLPFATIIKMTDALAHFLLTAIRSNTQFAAQEIATTWWEHLSIVDLKPFPPEISHRISKNLESMGAIVLSLSQPAHVPDLSETHKHPQEKEYPSYQEGPGHFRREGPRHDNDNAKFRDIVILPTMGEILSEHDPYLQRRLEEGKFGLDHVDKILDRLFRLFRHDSLQPVMSAIRYCYLNKVKILERSTKGTDGVGTLIRLPQDHNTIILQREVRFERLQLSLANGSSLRFSFRQPKQGSERKRRTFWEEEAGRQLFARGSIVVVWFNRDEGVDDWLLATVNERRMCLEKDRILLGLRPLNTAQIHSCLRLHAHQKPNAGEMVLFTVHKHFFTSVLPVLEALRAHSICTLPLQPSIVPEMVTGRRLPAYLDAALGECKMDLTSILRPECPKEIKTIFRQVPVQSTKQLHGFLYGHATHLLLDLTQIMAFAAGLTQEVSVIQGPPGCGKTYIGVRLFLALVANIGSSKVLPAGPILCITYTNHALDQFLRALLAHPKYVREEHVLRLGHQSKDDILASCTMHEKEFRAREPREVRERKAAQKRASQMQDGIKEDLFVLQMTISDLTLDDLEDFVVASDEVLNAIEDGPPHAPYDDALDGFMHVGKNNKVIKEPLQKWLNAFDLLDSPQAAASSASSSDPVEAKGEKDPSDVREETEDEKFAAALARLRVTPKNARSRAPPKESVEKKETAQVKKTVELEVEEEQLLAVGEIDLTVLDASPTTVWTWTKPQRWKVAQQWLTMLKERALDRTEKQVRDFEDGQCADYEAANLQVQRRIAAQARVIGMTTSGAAKNQALLMTLKPAIVICEEAGEVSEPHLIASLSEGCQHLILIGDHLQLRSKVSHPMTVESQGGYDLDMSLFERLALQRSFFPSSTTVDIGASSTSSYDTQKKPEEEEEKEEKEEKEERDSLVTLHDQRRMAPCISQLIRPLYPNLHDNASVLGYPMVRGMAERVWFFDHAHRENADPTKTKPKTKAQKRQMKKEMQKLEVKQADEEEEEEGDEDALREKDAGIADLTSKSNEWEAQMVVALVSHLVKQGYQPSEIAVLCPYSGQLFKIRTLLENARVAVMVTEQTLLDEGELIDPDLLDDAVDDGQLVAARREVTARLRSCVRLATVDGFQGEEAEVVIISTVRNNDEKRTGFLKTDNRVNVMLSRAKHGMYLFGSSETVLAHSSESLFGKAIRTLQAQNLVGDGYLPIRCDRHPEHVQQIREPSDFAQWSPDGGCRLPCAARLKCGHTCQKSCHGDLIDDDDDHDTLERKKENEHEIGGKKGKTKQESAHEGIQCHEPCPKHCPHCKTPCRGRCGETCPPCQAPVSMPLACLHFQSVPCHQRFAKPDTIRCTTKIPRPSALACAHNRYDKDHLVACSDAQAAETALRDSALLQRKMAEWPEEKKVVALCPASCGGVRAGCDHACENRCGDCVAERLATENPDAHAASCQHKCDRARPFCAHRCEGTCHAALACPPCDAPCMVSCEHSTCARRCGAPCAVCAHPCAWQCTHQTLSSSDSTDKEEETKETTKTCALPCGIPCARLPCDEPCGRPLKCGHPCPTVCGEPCPDPKVACPTCATPEKKASTISFVEFKTLNDFDPSGPPLVVFGCGHSLLVSDADAMFQMRDLFYTWQPLPSSSSSSSSSQEDDAIEKSKKEEKEKEEGEGEMKGKWTGVRPFQSDNIVIPSCPLCRTPLTGARRYKRIVNWVQLSQSGLKFTTAHEKEAAGVIKMATRCATEASAIIDRFKKKTLEGGIEKRLQDLDDVSTRSLRACQRLQKARHPFQKADRLVAVRETAPAAMRSDAWQFETALAELAHTYAYALSLAASLSLRQNGRHSNKNEETMATIGAALQATLEAFDQVSAKALPLADANHLRLGKIRFQIAHISYRLQMRSMFAIAALQGELANKTNAVAAPLKALMDSTMGLLDEMLARGGGSPALAQLQTQAAVLQEQVRKETPLTAAEYEMVVAAMAVDVGSGRGSFGGHYYACPNGHPYAIADCGGANQTTRCPECNELIGGESHRLNAGNTVFEPMARFLD